MSKKAKKTMVCRLAVDMTWGTRQEVYETSTGDARRRANQLRKAGFRVISASLGPQTTPVGSVRLTALTIEPINGKTLDDIPHENWSYQPF